MDSLRANMDEYKRQLKKGAIQKAYRVLQEYILELRTRFESDFPEYSVSGGIYHGYMDMTYFALFPEELKKRKLKIAIVFVYDSFRFEIWLSASNKRIQSEYWKLFNESTWDKYRIVPTPEGYDSIVEHVLVDNPDFNDRKGLTKRIEISTKQFIKDIELFLSAH